MYLRDSLLHICAHVHTHTHTHTHTHMQACTHTCTHAHILVHTHTHICTHIHSHICTCIHTHTSVHTHTCTDCQRKSHTLVFQIYGGVKYGREACTAGLPLFQFQGLARLLAGNGVALCRPGSAACARWKSKSAADVQTVSGNSQMRPAPLDLLSDEERMMRDAGKHGCGETKAWPRVNSLQMNSRWAYKLYLSWC